ncbi:MAG TPA: histidine phosphatase family protein [Nitrospirota bacterium]|nr:histidine phosphatase family protein [Nitrospirota bacterium]
MQTKVYLMRHGEVANDGEKRYNGHIDVDITENGVQQMHRLAGLLESKNISAVYSSDLLRSQKGADIISRRIGKPYLPLRELRERSVGAWEGLTGEEIKARFPDEYLLWRADLLNYRPPGGECLLDVKNRILPVFRNLLSSHPGQEIAMLLHGGVNRVILADALGLDMRNLFRIDQAFGAMNVIDYFDDEMAVVRLLNG